MNRAVIGVGSNIDPENNVIKAKAILAEEQTIIASSEFEHTPPISRKNHPWFLNGAFLIDTSLSRDELKGYLRSVEHRLGRIRTSDKYAPRTIDLDIVVWNGTIVDSDVHRRDFLRRAVGQVLGEIPEKNAEGLTNEEHREQNIRNSENTHPS